MRARVYIDFDFRLYIYMCIYSISTRLDMGDMWVYRGSRGFKS